jgi:hypothetical protein
MNERYSADDQLNDFIERYLQFLKGAGAEPDLGHLSTAQRREMRARLDVVDALVGLDPDLPPLEEDPVAMRLGLVPDRRDRGEIGDDGNHSGPDKSSRRPEDGRYGAGAGDAVDIVLSELEASFHGQVVIDRAPAWVTWQPRDRFEHSAPLVPVAQCSVLGDLLALFVSEDADAAHESAPVALFLRQFPEVSAVAVVSPDAVRAQVLTAAACNRAVDPVRGWLEPGEFVISTSMDLCLSHYFQQRLPRWDRVARLDDLLNLGDPARDALDVTRAEVDRALGARPRLQYKRAAQQALRDVDPATMAVLIAAVQTGDIDGDLLTQRVIAMAGDTS